MFSSVFNFVHSHFEFTKKSIVMISTVTFLYFSEGSFIGIMAIMLNLIIQTRFYKQLAKDLQFQTASEMVKNIL